MATTFEKTWAFDLNNDYTPSNALDLTRYTMWWIAAALTGNLGFASGLWTLYASSDSSTAGTDTTDRWVLAGPYDGTKIVRGSGSNVHSWIVLSSPTINGSTWYMILSFNSASDAAIRISYSKTAPSGGSTTVTPTASGQWWPNNGNTAADCTINAAATDASRFHMGLTSEGGWYFVANKQAATVPNIYWHFFGLANYATNDLYPVNTAASYMASGAARVNVSSNTSPFDLSGANNVRDWDGSATAVKNYIMWPIAGWSATTVSGAQTSGARPQDGTHGDLPALVGAYPGSGAAYYYRGRIPDLAVCVTTLATLVDGAVSPVSGSVDSCRVGMLWLPANAAMNFS